MGSSDTTPSTVATGTAGTPAFAAAVPSRRPHGAAADPPAAIAPLSEREKVQLDLLRNARHHEDRERFFDRIHRFAMFIVVLSGTAAFGKVFDFSGVWGLAAAGAGLLDLVFDLSGRARCHAGLKREAFRLLADLEAGAELQTVRQRQIASYGDEPVSSGTVDAVAYNSAMLSMGRDPLDLIKVSATRRILRHLWTDASDLRTYRELREAPPEGLTRAG